MSVAAYKRTISHTETPRGIERRVLAQVTAELETSYSAFDSSEGRFEKLEILGSGFRQVLWRNQQIWAAFKMDLLEEGNQLSPELRSSLISIAIWVEKHTQGVLSGEKPARPLIDINRSIVDGLDGRIFDAAAE
jgi:flagellar protein FlaF